MMKVLKYIVVAYFAIFLASCEKNDRVLELGESIGTAPNVYMDALDPTFSSNITLQVPIEYWLEGKAFGDFSMNHSIDTIAAIEFEDVANTGYYYTDEFEDEILELTEYGKGAHDPAYWTPDLYVYSFDSPYFIDPVLAKVKYKDSDTPADEFVKLLSTEFWSEFYANLVSGMTKEQFEKILVVDNSIITEAELDSYYDEDGALTENGEASLLEDLQMVPKSYIIGEDYEYEKKNRVSLQYWIYSTSNILGKSDTRSFIVK